MYSNVRMRRGLCGMGRSVQRSCKMSEIHADIVPDRGKSGATRVEFDRRLREGCEGISLVVIIRMTSRSM